MPSDVLYDRIHAQLLSRKNRNVLRRLSDPADLIDFSSNDYLGLSKNQTLRERFLRVLAQKPHILGSGGSRLLDGNTSEQIILERRLAQFFNAPAALFYSSGYDANVGFFTCVPQKGDTVIYDALIHASVHDGIRASRVHSASHIPFQHNSVESLESTIVSLMKRDENLANGSVCLWVAVESLYSMDGDIAPLDQIIDLVEKMCPLGNGHVIVDEAHSTGIYGTDGRGLVAMANLENRVLVRLHTFGKALASNGAVILTKPWLREYLINYSRPLIYTTAPANYNAIAIQCALDVLESSVGRQLAARVLQLSTYFKSNITEWFEDSPNSLVLVPPRVGPRSSLNATMLETQIVPLLTPHPHELSQYLKEHFGILARPIVHPTVPKGEERVRVCIHANNTEEELDRLLHGVNAWIQSYGQQAPEKRGETVARGPRPRL